MGPVGDFSDEWFGSTLLTSKAAPNHKAPKKMGRLCLEGRTLQPATRQVQSALTSYAGRSPVGLIEDMELQRSGDWPVAKCPWTVEMETSKFAKATTRDVTILRRDEAFVRF